MLHSSIVCCPNYGKKMKQELKGKYCIFKLGYSTHFYWAIVAKEEKLISVVIV